MWKLTPPDADLIKWYKKKMLKGLKSRIIDDDKLPGGIKMLLVPSFIDESILIHLLTDKPKESLVLNNRLNVQIKTFVALNPFQNYNDIVKRLSIVFDYKNQISEKKNRSYYISHKQSRNTCTYCNRLYTFTVVHNEDKPLMFKAKTNDRNRIVRPQLDHWFDKASYPLLSLNIYNLIPSCPICNSSVKGSNPFTLATHIHPYLNTEDEPKFKFKLSLDKKGNPKTPFVIEIDDSQCSTQEKNMIRDFALKEIYAYHGEHEGKDLYLWRLENDTLYLHDLFNKIGGNFKRSTEEIFRMFFGTEYLSTNNLNRPFSKLKRDLLFQLGLLDATGRFIP